jgi:hypothetical protein
MTQRTIVFCLFGALILSWYNRSRDSSVGVATGYRRDDGGVGTRVPARQEFSHFHVQTDSGAHPVSYPMGTGGAFPGEGVKRQGREADHSPVTTAEVKQMWIYTSFPHTPLWRSA